jgi:hypothetical protein
LYREITTVGPHTFGETLHTLILITITGITVIDLSDLSNPAYCFVNIDELESVVPVPKDVPLIARQYFEAYYPPGSEQAKEEPHLSLFVDRLEDAGWKLCEQRWLDEAFPSEGYAPGGADVSDTHDEQEAGGTDEASLTLALQALKVVVQRLCASDTDPDVDIEKRSKMLDDLMDSPGLDVPLVLSLLATDGPVLAAPATELVVRPLKRAASTSGTDVAEGRLDLSSFPLDLRSIRQIVDALPETVLLDLSSNGPGLDSDTLAHFGATLPRLQNLFLMGNAAAKLTLEQLDALLCTGGALSHIHAVYHSALFTRSLRTRIRNIKGFITSDVMYDPPHSDPPFSLVTLCVPTLTRPLLVVASPRWFPPISSSACPTGLPAPRRRRCPSASTRG